MKNSQKISLLLILLIAGHTVFISTRPLNKTGEDHLKLMSFSDSTIFYWDDQIAVEIVQSKENFIESSPAGIAALVRKANGIHVKRLNPSDEHIDINVISFYNGVYTPSIPYRLGLKNPSNISFGTFMRLKEIRQNKISVSSNWGTTLELVSCELDTLEVRYAAGELNHEIRINGGRVGTLLVSGLRSFIQLNCYGAVIDRVHLKDVSEKEVLLNFRIGNIRFPEECTLNGKPMFQSLKK